MSADVTADERGVEFLVSPSRDLTMMAKYGLGGAALVDDRYVYAGGMAIDLETLGRVAEAETVADETRICFEGIAGTLAMADCTLADIAKITCYVSDRGHNDEMWAEMKRIFSPGPFPKRLTLVAGIAGDCRVEFEVMAVVRQGEDS